MAVALVALLAGGLPRPPEPGEAVRIDASTPTEAIKAILARDPTANLTWHDSLAPTRDVAALLAAGARGGADVSLAVPEGAGALSVVAPHRPMAGRRAALSVRVRGEPNTDVPVTITGQAGATDTVVVTTGPDRRGSASVAVEPTASGLASWTVRTPVAQATAHAWVRPARPVRVLVWSGTPGWESRYLLRALESAGVDVAARQDLGRSLSVTTEGAPAPSSLDDLSAYDVLILVGQAADSVGSTALRWVVERGGGLLLVGGGSAAPTLAPWAPRGEASELPAPQLAWSGPAEIVPLPESEIVTRAIEVPGSGIPVVSSGRVTGEGASGGTDGPVLARASYRGRGRLFATGLESWPWVMEAGLVAEHQAFWKSVVDWLAGGLTEDVSLVGGVGQPRARWTGRLDGDVPPTLTLTRPDGDSTLGGDSTLDGTADRDGNTTLEESLSPRPAFGGSSFISFVPASPGGHGLATAAAPIGGEPASTIAPDLTPAFGAIAAPPTERLTWTAAASVLGRAGAHIVRADARSSPNDARPAAPSRTLPWLLFVTLAALAATGWTARRVAGRP